MPKQIKKTKKNKVTKTPKKTPKTPKKARQPVVAPVAAPVVDVAPVTHFAKTESEKIWDEIKDLPIEMFAIPNQVVSQHCNPFQVEPTRLYLTIRSSATLPSLEASLNSYSAATKAHAAEMAKRGHKVEVKEYTLEQADRFVIVARAPAPLPVPPKR